jgi:two-component system nitrogen regulation sensor histidine kinase GlnL
MENSRNWDMEALINSLGEAILLLDKNNSIIFINRTGEEFFGKSRQELIGKKLAYLLPEVHEIPDLSKKTIKEMRSFSIRDIDAKIGSLSKADFDLSPCIVGDKCEGALISIRKNVSIAEREDSSFDSLVYLIGSIAHEIKNPLGGIKGAAQLLRKKLMETESAGNNEPKQGSDDDSAEYINLIIRETDRLNAVLQGYLTMSKKPALHPMNVHEAVEKAISIMNISLKNGNVSLHRLYDPSLPKVIGDEAKLLQVFLNIIKNAIEAMPGGGALTVSTRPSSEHVVHDGQIKRWVVVSVADTGKGISKNDMQKIFLPFYTKKRKGTGLGLALSKKIIKDHNGFIRIEKPHTGKGTVFNVYIPFAV